MLKEIIKTIDDDNTIWVMENRENNDKIFKNFITDKLFSSTIVIVSKNVAYFLVHKLDEGNISVLDKKCSKVFIYSNSDELKKYLIDILNIIDYPQKILLSYTTMSDENTDIITHSSYVRIAKIFRELYKEAGRKFQIGSAEMNIYNILSKNNNVTISRLKSLANITDEILKLSFRSIKEFQTEIEISNNTKNITKTVMKKYNKKLKINSYDFAWKICPIVLVGKDLEKGGHAIPSNTKIKQGDTIYFDFGIKAEFNDGEILYTDMQRMGYLLKDKENMAPKAVQDVFDTLVSAIKLGVKAMKPGVKAYKIDKIVRGKIYGKYGIDYPHATGHPVGHEVHGAGALISIKSSKRANLPLVESGIYTLEPRVDIPNGGSIEEMVEVTENGGKPLCKMQEQIYLIR